MAYWRLAFQSYNGWDYEVRIDGASTGKYLTAAPDPIVIQEDIDRDIFKPIRHHTGYIRFLADDTSWKDMLPTTAVNRPVYLYRINGQYEDLMWQGYLKPEVYTANLYDYPQVIELPIVGELSTIGRNKPGQAYRNATYNLARLLYHCFIAGGSLGTTPWWTFLYIQGGSVITSSWLKYRIQWSLFYDVDSSSVYGYSSKYDWLQILEHVCTFFGWSCRVYERSIYLCALDDSTMNTQFVKLTPANLATLATGGSVTPSTVNVVAMTTSDAVYKAGSSEEVLQGINSCEVVANIGKIGTVLEMPWNEIEEYIKNVTITQTKLAGDPSSTIGVYKFQRTPTYFNEDAFGRFLLTTNSGGTVVISGSTFTYKAFFDDYQVYEGNTFYLRNYSLNHVLNVQGTYPQDQAMVIIETVDSFNFQNGILVISGDTKWEGASGDDYSIKPGNGHLIARVHVGEYVWNGSYWELDSGVDSPWVGINTGTWPQVATGSGSILNTRQLDDPYPAYDGYGMPIGASIGGPVKLEIKGYYDKAWASYQGYGSPIFISNLKIEFYRSTSVPNYNDNDSNRYTASSGKFLDNITIDTIFASDNGNGAGRGIVMYADMSYITTIPYGTGTTQHRPEQHLADRIAAQYGNKTHNVLVLDTLTGYIQAIDPHYKVELNGKTYATVSISHNYWNNEVSVILVEI